MNQRDRITMAMMYPDLPLDAVPQGLETGAVGGGPGLPPPPYKPHPRNLLRGDQGISQELMDDILRKEGGGMGGGSPMDPETRRLIEEAINGPREYNEWDTVPAKNPRMGELETRPPLPPSVLGEQPPDWATRESEMPFLRYDRGGEEDA